MFGKENSEFDLAGLYLLSSIRIKSRFVLTKTHLGYSTSKEEEDEIFLNVHLYYKKKEKR